MHASPQPVARRLALIALALGLAVAGCLYQVFLASEPINDRFMNVVWGREILSGRLPVRDFFEAGEPLSEVLSAAAEAVVGYRLLSEALVGGLAVGTSVWLVFWVTHGLTRSAAPSLLAAALVVFAGTRSYSYPKVLIYAGAAALIWKYVNRPSRAWLMGLACWTGVAFLWRHDHGVYVALATAATVAVVHGRTRTTITRLLQAGMVALLVTGPYLAWVQVHRGLLNYWADGMVVMQSEFNDNPPILLPPWPLRHLSDVVGFQAPAAFAPVIGLRWSPSSTPVEREASMRAFDVIDATASGPDAVTGTLLDPSPQNIRGLLNDPSVADTEGLNRSTSSIPWTSWGPLDRARFRYKSLRVRPFPAFDDAERAGEVAKWIFMTLAVGTLCWACWPRRVRNAGTVPDRMTLGLIAGLLAVSMPGLLRLPLSTYSADAVALPAILAIWTLWTLWQRAARSSRAMRVAARLAVVVCAGLLVFSITAVGLFERRFRLLMADDAWSHAWSELITTPPIALETDEPANSTAGLARYVHACTSPDASLLVLAFAPDLQYYADRRLASRHLLLGPGRWTSESDQAASLDTLRRSAPPIVIAGRPFYDQEFPTLYPLLADYIRAEYRAQGEILDHKDHRYTVFTRNAVAPVRTDPEHGWPCFTPAGTR
ncbi:MAG: hypothetical protein EXR91_13045 [Gemmatimonadetes bacterium]|nr:hypothetical protein [Gemmatimonadota bacterium]